MKILVGGLIVSGLLWCGVWLSRRSEPDSVALTTEDLAAVASVFHVTARPPSLFVELKTVEWSDMTDRERIEALEEMGRIAERAGYSGVHARTDDGSGGGQWLLRGGASLLEKPRGRT